MELISKRKYIKFNNGGRMIPKALNGWWKSGIAYDPNMSEKEYRDALIEKMRNDEELRQRVFGVRYNLFDTWYSRGTVSAAIKAEDLRNNYKKWKENGERVKGNQKFENTSGDVSGGAETPKPLNLADSGAWDFNGDGNTDAKDITDIQVHFNNQANADAWKGMERKNGWNYSNDNKFGRATRQMFDYAKANNIKYNANPTSTTTPSAANIPVFNLYVGQGNIAGLSYDLALAQLNAYNQSLVGGPGYLNPTGWITDNNTISQQLADAWGNQGFTNWRNQLILDGKIVNGQMVPEKKPEPEIPVMSDLQKKNTNNFFTYGGNRAWRKRELEGLNGALASGNLSSYQFDFDGDGQADNFADALSASGVDLARVAGRGYFKSRDLKKLWKYNTRNNAAKALGINLQAGTTPNTVTPGDNGATPIDVISPKLEFNPENTTSTYGLNKTVADVINNVDTKFKESVDYAKGVRNYAGLSAELMAPKVNTNSTILKDKPIVQVKDMWEYD